MMRTIHLHGGLAKRFGPSFKFDIDTPAEAGRALAICVPGFASYVHDKYVRVVRGNPDGGIDFDHQTLGFRLGQCPDLHIIPIARGAEKNMMGIVKIVIGVALIALSFVFPGFGAAGAVTLFTAQSSATLLVAGAAMSLAGIASLLSPGPPTPKTSDKPDDRASAIFTGAVNRIEEGGIVPIGYGRMRIGSILGSGSLEVEKVL